MKTNREDLITGLFTGDYRAIARCITIVENELTDSEEILLRLKPKNTPVIGFTGPPGAGKSTLVNDYVGHLLQNDKKVAVIAVDPSSPFNFGALLGDRIRMLEHFKNQNLYIRSVASRGSLGGLSDKITDIVEVLKSAPFDYIIIETVGVGQSEIDVVGVADYTAVVLVPEAGDQIQGMKAGLMEIADLFVINKADREGADTMFNNLQQMLMYRSNYKPLPVLKTIATNKNSSSEMALVLEGLITQDKEMKEMKINLLAIKVYRVIQRSRMKDIDMNSIISDLKLHYHSEENIYTYIKNRYSAI
jgi:LAO/AO transport system kinase